MRAGSNIFHRRTCGKSLKMKHHAVNRRRQAHERPPAPCALRLGPSDGGNVQSLRL